METGRVRQISDQELRLELEEGLRPVDIARKYGVSRQAISKRVRQLGLTTVAAMVAPLESQRFVRRNIDAIEQITKSLYRVNLLMDACHEWLTDANDPTKYDIGPRADEVTVTYLVEDDSGKQRKEKATLSHLLHKIEQVYDVDSSESKHADPRELILKTAQEARSTLTAAADLAKTLADVRMMESFRELVLREIGKIDPGTSERIEEALRCSFICNGILGEPPRIEIAA